MTSKGATNRRWTSSEKYRENWDRIFRMDEKYATWADLTPEERKKMTKAIEEEYDRAVKSLYAKPVQKTITGAEKAREKTASKPP